jgi:hypothetical protein
MGIDYQPKLIIGFPLNDIKVQEWMNKHDCEDCYDINEILKEKYPEISDSKIVDLDIVDDSDQNLSIYVTISGNHYSGEVEYFLTFYIEELNVRGIKNITEDLLNLAKKIFKEIENDELECKTIDDIPIFSTLHIY